MRLLAIVPPLLLAMACSPEPEDTSPGDTDTDADADADTDTDADADADTDTDTGDPHGVGLTGHKGEVVVDPLSWLGVESWYFTADKGMGDDLCLVTWDSTSTAVRSDCAQCDWAFDVVWTDPRVEIDEAPSR